MTGCAQTYLINITNDEACQSGLAEAAAYFSVAPVSFTVYSTDSIEDFCYADVQACLKPDRNIMVSDHAEDPMCDICKHEAAHDYLQRFTGNSHPDHDHPAFGEGCKE